MTTTPRSLWVSLALAIGLASCDDTGTVHVRLQPDLAADRQMDAVCDGVAPRIVCFSAYFHHPMGPTTELRVGGPLNTSADPPSGTLGELATQIGDRLEIGLPPGDAWAVQLQGRAEWGIDGCKGGFLLCGTADRIKVPPPSGEIVIPVVCGTQLAGSTCGTSPTPDG